MNLYLLSQSEVSGYDTFDSCVVVAKDEKAARKIYPGLSSPISPSPTWSKPEYVKVELIGVAARGLKGGEVVCSSFNAG
jgi:hypothetical protein